MQLEELGIEDEATRQSWKMLLQMTFHTKCWMFIQALQRKCISVPMRDENCGMPENLDKLINRPGENQPLECDSATSTHLPHFKAK